MQMRLYYHASIRPLRTRITSVRWFELEPDTWLVLAIEQLPFCSVISITMSLVVFLGELLAR